MNLSPSWQEFLKNINIHSIHWASVGSMTATDREIFDYALQNNYIIITQDLDFSTILALTNSEKPSVILIRAKNSLPKEIGKSVSELIRSYSDELEKGSLIVFDGIRHKVRILPL
ncbi:MAG: DUF5615 family PIN-like protein [Leptospira sp.]|nr:DUF5615 family PIN-like protein [Leptospira sp.]